MSLTGHYREPADLPATLPVFPLGGALLLPRCQIPLNIFEQRYVRMVDDAMAAARLIGMVQPANDAALAQQDDPAARPELYDVGCAGRITSYTETGDGRILVTLTGVCRFRIEAEQEAVTPYRQCRVDFGPFAADLTPGAGETDVSRERLLDILKAYLDAHGLQADWDTISTSSNEALVNSLCCISPYGPREKQALLEAESLEARNQMLIALTEIALAGGGAEPGSTVQ